MRIANSVCVAVVGFGCAAGLAAQPVVVAELRIESRSVLERTATLASPAAVRGLEDRWVAEAARHFGFVSWKRAADAPASTPRLVLQVKEEMSQGCLPGRLTMVLSASGNGVTTTHQFTAGREEFKLPCDPDWQEEGAEAFAGDFQKWIESVPFAPDAMVWIQDNLLRKVKLADGIVTEGEHLFLPVKPRTLKASSDSEIYVRFGRDVEDGFAFVRPHGGQGDRTQVFVTAFSCGDTVSSTNLDADRAGFGRVWHPLLTVALQRCQFPAAFMWRYVDEGIGDGFAPPPPGPTNLPRGGTALDPDGGR